MNDKSGYLLAPQMIAIIPTDSLISRSCDDSTVSLNSETLFFFKLNFFVFQITFTRPIYLSQTDA
jgi:hypothetical protein